MRRSGPSWTATTTGSAQPSACPPTPTTGRRSGRPHRIEIWYAGAGTTLYLLAGGGRRSDWVQNLVANPDASIEVDNQVVAVRAREATGEERDRLWNEHVAQLPEFGEYPKKTDRVIPMILLERVD